MSLGLVVIVGWYTERAALVQIRAGSAAMAFNAALGFVVSGLALLLLVLGWPAMAGALGAALALGALLTLAEYLLGADLRIDQVFFAGTATEQLTHDARMAPNTAVCFLLLGSATLLVPWLPMAVTFFGSAVLVISGVAFVGYLAGIPQAVSWGRVPGMALPSSLAFLALGSGFMVAATGRNRSSGTLGPKWTPHATGAIAVLGSLLLWRALIAHQDANLRRTVRAAAASTHAEIVAAVHDLTRVLQGFAAYTSPHAAPLSDWRLDAALILERSRGVAAVEFFDPVFQVRQHVEAGNAAGREPAEPLDDAQRRVFETVRSSRGPAVTPPFRLADGDLGFRVVVPTFATGRFEGFIAATVHGEGLFSGELETEDPQFAILLTADGEEIYRRGDPRSDALRAWGKTRRLVLPGGATWLLTIWPSPSLFSAVRTALPEIILVSGVLIALLLVATLRLVKMATLRARELEKANRRLRDEVDQRRRAEEDVRAMAQQLEGRVQDRTVELADVNATLRGENLLRQRAQARLAHSNEELSRFAAFLSHELRQPLATMKLWIDLLESTSGDLLPEQQRTYLEKTRASIGRMARLIEQELELAQVAHPQASTEQVDLLAVVREITAELDPQLRRIGGRIEVGEMPVVRADAMQMRQLLRNLIENAIKYRRPDTPLVIRVEGAVRRPQGLDEGVCEFHVADNGQGFEPGEREQIFEAFRRLRGESIEGSGLGLAICRRIVDRHGGSITAEGTPGEGAAFHVELPIDRCEDSASPHAA